MLQATSTGTNSSMWSLSSLSSYSSKWMSNVRCSMIIPSSTTGCADDSYAFDDTAVPVRHTTRESKRARL